MPGMRFTVEGEIYDYSGRLMLPEAIAIEKATGLTQPEWEEKLQKGGALAQAALIWVLMRRKDAPGTPPFADLTYDTHEVDITFLRDDGTAVDMAALNARGEELIAAGMKRDDAMKQASEELMKPVAAEVVPENPTVGATIAPPAPEPPPTPSSELPSPTPEPSPITSVSAPGSSIA